MSPEINWEWGVRRGEQVSEAGFKPRAVAWSWDQISPPTPPCWVGRVPKGWSWGIGAQRPSGRSQDLLTASLINAEMWNGHLGPARPP